MMLNKSGLQIRLHRYWSAAISILMNPAQIPYYLRQFQLVCKFGQRLKLLKYTVRFPFDIDLHIGKNASLCFGDKCYLSSGTRMHVLESSDVRIGNNFFINRNSSIVSRYGVKIGDNCMIAESVFIYDHDHVFDDMTVSFNEQGYTGTPIIIGNNVWIGSHVFIGKGVRIGDNVIVGAGAVVVKDIPSKSIVKMNKTLIVSGL